MATLVNGRAYDFASITISFLGNSNVYGCSAISYSVKQEKQNNYGLGNSPVSQSFGKKEYEGSITLDRKEWDRILEASGVSDLTDVAPFDMIINYSNGVDASVTDKLCSVSFKEHNISAGVDDLNISSEIPLLVGGVFFKQ